MKSRKIYRRIAAAAGLMAVLVLGAWGQDAINVRVEQVISDNYPEMKVFMSVEDANRKPVPALVRGNFAALIDKAEQKDRFEVAGFQYTEAPVSYIVLMTVNGLLEGEPIAQQKAAVMNLIDQMGEKDTLSVYLIGEQPKILFENVAKAKIDAAILPKVEADPENISKIYDSLNAVARKVKDAPNERKVLIVLSDGRDQQSRTSRELTARAITEANVPVYSIGIKIMGGAALSTLDWLSQSSGGVYFYSSSHEQIAANMGALIKRLMQSYVIRFTGGGISADDDLHQLTLQVLNEGAEGKASKSFLAKKVPVPLWLKIVLIVVIILVLAALILGFILFRRKRRQKMGINARRCPDCGARMKDDWEFCPFCTYLPDDKKKKPKKKDKK